MYSFNSIVESEANMNGVRTWDDNFIQKFTTYSFKFIVESEANVNVNGVGIWDDNSLFIQISIALVAKNYQYFKLFVVVGEQWFPQL